MDYAINESLILRDVMNSKSDRHFRHSENAYDIKKLSFYYALESRIFNGVWDETLQKNVRGPLWFTNIMVFDFDFDEKHFPNVEDYQKKLNDSLNKLESILGKPKYKIFNKNEYTQWEMDVYFTKNGEVNLPKKCGCQVVYELKDSVKSQWVEIVNLYNSIRLHISSLVDADLNFKGHMFKNPFNSRLFKIEEIKNFDALDIFEVAKSLGYKDVERIKNSKPFETLKVKNTLPSYLKKWNSMLLSFYQDLNTWKSNDWKVNWKNKMFYIQNCKRSESRNETLFEYFKSLPLHSLESIQYHETVNSNLFDSCAIKDPLEESEWEITKQSVLTYRKTNNVEFIDKNIDSRVFKWNQNAFNINFYSENSQALRQSVVISKHNKSIISNWLSFPINIDLYGNSKPEEILANVFLSFGAENILSNVKNLISSDMLDFYQEILKNENINEMNPYGMWDMYCILKGALYLTHFKYYKSIQNFRHSKQEKAKTKLEIRDEMFKEWGINYQGDILGFKRFYQKLKKHNLLKENGDALPISFYQNHFHIRNTFASIFVKLIKKYCKISLHLNNLLALKRSNISHTFKLIAIKGIFSKSKFDGNSLINHSRLKNYLIKSFNILYLFNNKDKRWYNLYYGITYINNTYDNNYNKLQLNKYLYSMQTYSYY